jgi:hypothetical protein
MNSNLIKDDLVNFIENSDYEILTPDGWKDFSGIANYGKKKLIRVTTSNGKNITVSHNHLFSNKDKDFLAKDSLHEMVGTIDGESKIVSIEDVDDDDVYDIVNVKDTHKFYGNGICNHNTHLMDPFWASVFPIVSASSTSKVFICSTANGTGNLFHKLYTDSLEGKNGWVNDKILWHEVPGRTQTWADKVKSGLASEEKWQQEYECCGPDTILDIENMVQKLTIKELFEYL